MYNHKKFREIFFTSDCIFEDKGTKRGAVRIAPGVKLDTKELHSSFFNHLSTISINIAETIPPSETAPSKKFNSYILEKEQDKFYTTLSGGIFCNRGLEFERKVYSECVAQGNSLFLDSAEDFFDTKIVGVVPGMDFNRAVSRPLTLNGGREAGKDIADIVLIDTLGRTFPISIKGIHGKTISNNGAAGMFGIEDNRVIYTNSEKNNLSKPLFEATGVNPLIVSNGLTDYKHKISNGEYKNTITVNEFKGTTIKKLIESAFDYGYYLAKQIDTTTKCKFTDFSTSQKVTDYIGEVTSVQLRYPYYESEHHKRKSTDILINTTTSKYKFEIRNTDGDLIPAQINLQQW